MMKKNKIKKIGLFRCLVRCKRKLAEAFSLVEMLVVIAVIGIITAIAVPAISSITSEAEIAKDKRNAQNIATVYNTALAAAATTADLSRTDKSLAVDALQTGVSGTGAFQNALFLIDITDTEQPGAEVYLNLSNGIMSLTGL